MTGNNTGIQFPVELTVAKGLSETNAHVVQNTAADLSSSALTVKTDVTNNTGSSQTGTVTATITPPDGGTPISAQQSTASSAISSDTSMLRIAQMISPEEIPKSFRPRSKPFKAAETTCWWLSPIRV